MTKNPEVFEGKQFKDVLKDIYDNTAENRDQIEVIIKSLLGTIQGQAANAAMVAPLLKDLLEVSVKNNEHIVKVASIIQRLMSSELQNTGEGLDSMLSDDEKDRLILEAEEESAADLNEALKETEQVRQLQQSAAAVVSGTLVNAPTTT